MAKRGMGVYFKDVDKEGFNPITNETVIAKRRELVVDYELPIGEAYREFILKFLTEE